MGELASERDEVDLYIKGIEPAPLQRALYVANHQTLREVMEAASRLDLVYKSTGPAAAGPTANSRCKRCGRWKHAGQAHECKPEDIASRQAFLSR